MAAQAQDPFYFVKEDISQSVNKAATLFTRWKALHEQALDSDSQEFDWTTGELVQSLKSIEWDLEDLDESINIAEANRQRFRIDADEIKSRRAYVAKTRGSVAEMKKTITDPSVKQKRDRLARDALMAHTAASAAAEDGGRMARVNQAIDEDNDNFIRGEMQVQDTIVEGQDQDLAALEGTIDTIREIGIAINTEVELHNKLLGDLDEKVGETQSRLDSAMNEIKKVMKQASMKKLICTVVILILVLVIVMTLVFALPS
eukprot:TRINITY_DN1866_c0_g1_i2.p2 TRINITY_DN1866_c0_g1~~TRINITY_DN1866_c0_g1_i2.p2  ORF type:complete len:259 (-),score=56.94 TRINITY_DN1866_c0_g1_i2:1810-2586(-)